jgi:hypothetical protein
LAFRAVAAGRQLNWEDAGVVGGNEVFKDTETGSRWQQSSLEAISGPLQGKHLELFPFLLTSWGEWHRLHPDSLVLKPLPGYADRVAAVNDMIRKGVREEGPAPNGVLHTDDRLKPHTMILGIDVKDDSKAFPLAALRDVKVINDRLGGDAIVIVHQPDSDTTTAFLAAANGRTLTFAAANAAATEVTDAQTHSRWDAYGRCVSGALRGAQLRSLILEPEYWFAWSEFHPKTAIYSAAASTN